MSSLLSSDASGASVIVTATAVEAGHTLFSNSSGYSVLEFIGEGCFGKVAKCQTLATQETVAVKIIKKDTEYIRNTEREVSMLEILSVLNPDHINVVKFFECFEYLGQTCLVFEMLDRNVYEFLKEQNWMPLSLNEIRPIAKQLLVALDALKGLGILHTDIKPDNVMFVNTQDQPLRVKLIDFGEAISASKAKPGMMIQPIGYRAPEVALGLPFNEAVDVWGVSCLLSFLYLTDYIFDVSCEYLMMKCMVEFLGQPEDHLLRAGIYTQNFFTEEETADGPKWRLMTPDEYEAITKVKPEEKDSYADLPSSLDDLVHFYPKEDAADFVDRLAFVDLMKQMLHLDGCLRISPHQALQHPFIMTESKVTVDDDFPTTESSDGVRVTYSSDKDSATRSSDEELSSLSSDEDSAAWSSDGELYSLSSDEDSAAWSFDEISSLSSDEGPAAWSSEGELSASWTKTSQEDEPALESSHGGLPYSSHNEDPAAWSSYGAKSADLTAAASASSGRTKKLKKRIRRFFSRIKATLCCCCRPTVED